MINFKEEFLKRKLELLNKIFNNFEVQFNYYSSCQIKKSDFYYFNKILKLNNLNKNSLLSIFGNFINNERIYFYLSNWHYTEIRKKQLGVPDWYTDDYFVKPILALEREGYLTIIQGDHEQEKCSVMIATQKLKDFLFNKQLITEEDKSPKAIIRDKNNNIIVPNTKREKTKLNNYAKEIENYNNFLKQFKVSFKETNIGINLKRIFKYNLESFGRIYSYGNNHFQGIPSDLRHLITINDNPTIECDFKAYHPRLCYHTKKLECPFTDPYLLTEDTTKTERELYKKIFLIMLNTTCYKSFSQAILNSQKEEMRNFKIKYDLSSTKLKDIFEKFCDKHTLIKDLICNKTNNGLPISAKIQFIDSSIMVNILKKCQDLTICALPIHDAVQIEIKNKELIKRIMIEEYNKIVGFNPIVEFK